MGLQVGSRSRGLGGLGSAEEDVISRLEVEVLEFRVFNVPRRIGALHLRDFGFGRCLILFYSGFDKLSFLTGEWLVVGYFCLSRQAFTMRTGVRTMAPPEVLYLPHMPKLWVLNWVRRVLFIVHHLANTDTPTQAQNFLGPGPGS